MMQWAKQWMSGGLTLLALFLLSIVVGVMLGGNAKRPSHRKTVPISAYTKTDREPGIRMSRVNAEVTEDGNRVQHFTARTGRLFSQDTLNAKGEDAKVQVLHMDDLAIEFFDGGSLKGKATSPRAKMWLGKDAKAKAERNDLLLVNRPGKPVEYVDTKYGRLESEQIRYFYVPRILRSGPYRRIFQFGGTPFQATGTRLEVGLTSDTARVVRFKESHGAWTRTTAAMTSATAQRKPGEKKD